MFSNGVWWFSFRYIVNDKFNKTGWMAIATALFYITFTVAGSVVSHWAARNLERGDMKVGK